MSTPLAMDPEEFRRLGYQAVDLLADYLGGLGERAVFTPMTPRERAAILDEPLSDAGLDAASLLERCRSQVLAHPMGNGHPRFFGWVNSPPAPLGVLGDFIAAGAQSRAVPAAITPRSISSAAPRAG